MAAASSPRRGLIYCSQPRHPPFRTKIVLDIKYKSVQYGLSQEAIHMINLPIKVAIHALWPKAEGVADLARQDRAGLIVETGHHMEDRGRLLQLLQWRRLRGDRGDRVPPEPVCRAVA